MQRSRQLFLSGLFFTTLSTLSLEILDTRLLSVITWYHLSFFAVSTAMFGMSAGAIQVYLGRDRFQGDRARAALAHNSTLFALSIPAGHILNLLIPIPTDDFSVLGVAALAFTTVAVAVPFFFSGVVVAIALTRIPGPSGLTYAVDLIGASLGCLLIVPLLHGSNISSATLVCGGIAAAGATCFHGFSASRRWGRNALLGLLLGGSALLNAHYPEAGLRVAYAKGMVTRTHRAGKTIGEYWTIHGFVTIRSAADGRPRYWGAGQRGKGYIVNNMDMLIDGCAGTGMTRWNGNLKDLEWLRHDVTSLPYHLRKEGTVAVIGVGGGRDILTALWARSRAVTGIEINQAIVEILTGPFRSYAGLADNPAVRIVHDEARSFLTRSQSRYDIVQMSLIDTWAATGAGAFTLSENGLYTTDGWKIFLAKLKPGGIFSVSRWYSPDTASETSRLVALATASLLERGVAEPWKQMALISRAAVATLMVSPEPFQKRDIGYLKHVSKLEGFKPLLLPGEEPTIPLLGKISRSSSLEELNRTVADPRYDYSPPTDQRPYFFNILKPRGFFTGSKSDVGFGTVAAGNLLATRTLFLLWVLSALLVAAVILGPLLKAGLPSLDRASFLQALMYFMAIGLGFMWVQIPLMQRFSVFLGHPVYAVFVTLFSMILAAGLGSLVSDRVDFDRGPRVLVIGPMLIAVLLLVLTFSIQSVIDATIARPLLARCSIVVAMVGVPAFFMGFCFPIGLRIVQRLADDALPWMWGVNGACSVFASVTAVAISMWSNIHTNLFLATAAYALLVLPAVALFKKGQG